MSALPPLRPASTLHTTPQPSLACIHVGLPSRPRTEGWRRGGVAGRAGGSKRRLRRQVLAWPGWRRNLVGTAWWGTARGRWTGAHRRATPLSVQLAGMGGQGHKAARCILDVGLPAQQQHRALSAHTRRQRWSTGGGRRGHQALRQLLHGKGVWRSRLRQRLLLKEGMRGGGRVGRSHRRRRRGKDCSMRRWCGVGAESCT